MMRVTSATSGGPLVKKEPQSEQFDLPRLAPGDDQKIETGQSSIGASRPYEEMSDDSTQFCALIQTALILQQTASYEEASTCIEIARQRLQLKDLGTEARILLLNADAYIHWSQGGLVDALRMVDESIMLADQTDLSDLRIYTHLLRANVLRAQIRYPEAHFAYEDACRSAKEARSEEFRAWIDVNLGWLDLLEGRYGLGTCKIMQAVDAATPEQAVSFNIFLAAGHNVTGRHPEAERLLLAGLDHYQKSGDKLSVFAIKLHLAYACLRMNQPQDACAYLTPALQWAEQKNVDYFPHWWHPHLVGKVCAHILKSNISPSVAKRMLIKHLPGEAVSLLSRELPYVSSISRRLMENVLDALKTTRPADLGQISDPVIRTTLRELLRFGRLRADNFARLQRKLTTARKHNAFNPVAVAVFGLYVHGLSRKEIARRLGRSESTVRNYITFIYEQFGFRETPIRSRFDRRIELRKIAQQEGFIHADEGPTNASSHQL